MPAAATLPAPPMRFRCSRKRMLMSIRVTLHHVPPAHVDLTTTKTHISVDTSRSRRKFKVSRPYPRGIECDDAQTTARMETNGMLVVEMPILSLPTIEPHQAERPLGWKRKAAEEAAAAKAAPKAKKKAKKAAAPPPADDAAPPAAAAAAPSAAAAAPTKQQKAAAKAARRAAGGASSSDGDVMGILDAATSAEEQRTARGLGQMRERQQAEAARAAKAGERKKLKEQKKKELLEALRAQKKERKAAAKPPPTPEPKPVAAGGKKRRVSFSPGT